MKLDQVDYKILEALQQDAKVNVKELADTLNLTKTPVYERIKKCEKEGVIDRYVAIVDTSKVSPNIVVFCSVSLETQKLAEIEKFGRSIENIPEVMECYLITGNTADYQLKIAVPDLESYYDILLGKITRIEGVSGAHSSFILRKIVDSTAVPLEYARRK